MNTNTYLQSQVYNPIPGAPRVTLRRSAGQMTFDPRIPVELASRLRDPQDVLSDYGYIGQSAFNLVVHPLFQVELKRALEALEGGLTFRERAKLMAPDVLEHAYDMATDKEISPAVRLDAAKWVVKMGDLEPKEDKSSQNNAFVLQIAL